MKHILPLTVLAVATFLAVWFLLESGDNSDDLSVFPEKTGGTSGPRELSAPRPVRHAESDTGSATEPDDGPSPAPVEDEGGIVVRTSRGGRPYSAGLSLDVFPDEGTVEQDPTGFRVSGIRPGGYQLTIHGSGFVPVVRRGVMVKPGAITPLDIALLDGIRPGGRVLHVRTRAPIAGARVEFGSFCEVVTDDNGKFDVPRLFPRTCLRNVQVSTPGFDIQRYRDAIWVDHRDMELFVGGGGGVLVCDIENRTGLPVNAVMEIRLGIEPIWELRRLHSVDSPGRVRFENLYQSRYRVEVRFPGGEFCSHFEQVSLSDAVETVVSIPLEIGTTLKGRLVGPELLFKGAVVQLLRSRGSEVIAESTVDGDGLYRFSNVASGSHRVRVRTGQGRVSLPLIEIPGDKRGVVRDIDLLRHRFLDGGR